MMDPEEDDITITAEGARIHASEKVSTADYETATYSVSLDLSMDGCDIEGDSLPPRVRARLLGFVHDLQKDVEHAANQRVRIADHENWSVPIDEE